MVDLDQASIELPVIICVNEKFMQNHRELRGWEVGSVFRSDKNQLAPVEEGSMNVMSLPRTKSLPRHAANRDTHHSVTLTWSCVPHYVEYLTSIFILQIQSSFPKESDSETHLKQNTTSRPHGSAHKHGSDMIL